MLLPAYGYGRDSPDHGHGGPLYVSADIRGYRLAGLHDGLRYRHVLVRDLLHDAQLCKLGPVRVVFLCWQGDRPGYRRGVYLDSAHVPAAIWHASALASLRLV